MKSFFKNMKSLFKKDKNKKLTTHPNGGIEVGVLQTLQSEKSRRDIETLNKIYKK